MSAHTIPVERKFGSQREASDEGTYELKACTTKITGIERLQRGKGRLELRTRKAEVSDGRLSISYT